MIYNILDGGDGRLKMIAKIIKNENPDFVTINEANGFDFNNQQKLKELSELTGLSNYYLALSGEYDYHVAVLSKYAFKSVTEIHPLKRAGIMSVFDTSIGELAIVSTHLAPNSESTRIPEIDLILSELKPYDNKMVMGDMNSLSDKDGYSNDIIKSFNDSQIRKFTNNGELQFEITNKIISAGFTDSGLALDQQKITTVPTLSNQDVSHSSLRLDYAFISESLKNNLNSYKVIKNELTEKASDHYPVVIELKNLRVS